MMTTLYTQTFLALLAIFGHVDSAAIGDIARNVHSDLLTLDAGLNPTPVRSTRQNFDVPAGKFNLDSFFVEMKKSLITPEMSNFNISNLEVWRKKSIAYFFPILARKLKSVNFFNI